MSVQSAGADVVHGGSGDEATHTGKRLGGGSGARGGQCQCRAGPFSTPGEPPVGVGVGRTAEARQSRGSAPRDSGQQSLSSGRGFLLVC